ncbi:MAG TPA: GNAT family N-acetyltransferase [Dongiaceae bacterium]|nr:GNAT family N-acetyltransferase [Dongiaceae bacterium]
MSGFAIALKDRLDAADLDGLAGLAQDAAQLLGYHATGYQTEMEKVLQDRCRHVLARDPGGVLRGYLPFREKAGARGTVLNALPFFGPNGLVLAADHAARDALLGAFREAAQRPDVISAVLYTPFLDNPEPIAAALRPDRRLVRMTQYLDLQDFAGWPKKRRGDLKRAAGAGFAIRAARPEDLDILYAIYVENCLEAGIPQKPRSYFAATLALAAGAAPRPWQPPLWLAIEHGGEIVGGLLAMRGAVTASYTIPIARSALRPLQPIAALIDAAVEMCRAGGIRYWNFESSPSEDDPVFKYKERWGALRAEYEVQVVYPNGAERLAGLTPEGLRQEYPFYFVCPYDDLKS